MRLKVLFFLMITVLLTSCYQSDNDFDGLQLVTFSSVSPTVIFLPGSRGIDFLVKPVYDNISYNKEFKADERTINLIVNAPPDKVIEEINNIFLEQEYIAYEREDSNSLAHYLYVKDNYRFTASFKMYCSEGFNCKKTEIFFWYLIADKNNNKEVF